MKRLLLLVLGCLLVCLVFRMILWFFIWCIWVCRSRRRSGCCVWLLVRLLVCLL